MESQHHNIIRAHVFFLQLRNESTCDIKFCALSLVYCMIYHLPSRIYQDGLANKEYWMYRYVYYAYEKRWSYTTINQASPTMLLVQHKNIQNWLECAYVDKLYCSTWPWVKAGPQYQWWFLMSLSIWRRSSGLSARYSSTWIGRHSTQWQNWTQTRP